MAPPYIKETMPGKAFPVDRTLQQSLLAPFFSHKLDKDPFLALTMDTAGSFVFAMAADRPFYAHALATIATVIKYFPAQQVVFHGLGGLQKKHIAIVSRWGTLGLRGVGHWVLAGMNTAGVIVTLDVAWLE